MGTGKRSSSTNPGSPRRYSSGLLGDGRRRLSPLSSSESTDLSWPLVSAWAGTVWFARYAEESGEVLNGDPGVQTIAVNVESRRGTPGVLRLYRNGGTRTRPAWFASCPENTRCDAVGER